MTEVVDPYVKGRLEYARKLFAEAKDALEFLKEAAKVDPVTGQVEPVKLERRLYEVLSQAWQVARDLGYGLDEAMAALKFYASADTWKEVPDHTFAAQDVGLKARVALARIDPV